MCDFEIVEPYCEGGKFRLVAVGTDLAGDGRGASHLVVFESESVVVIESLTNGIHALIDLALEADS